MLDLGDPSMTLAAGARRATMALLQGFAAQPRDDDLVRSEAVPVSYREADEYLDGSRLVNGPVPEAVADEPFFVMKRQVLRMEYDRCVAAEACKALDGGTGRCASRRRYQQRRRRRLCGLTIAAERIELSRLRRPGRLAEVILAAVVALLVALGLGEPWSGSTLFAAALAGLAAWLAAHDIALSTIRTRGGSRASPRPACSAATPGSPSPPCRWCCCRPAPRRSGTTQRCTRSASASSCRWCWRTRRSSCRPWRACASATCRASTRRRRRCR